MRASAVGGQPGTQISTGTMRSQPLQHRQSYQILAHRYPQGQCGHSPYNIGRAITYQHIDIHWDNPVTAPRAITYRHIDTVFTGTMRSQPLQHRYSSQHNLQLSYHTYRYLVNIVFWSTVLRQIESVSGTTRKIKNLQATFASLILSMFRSSYGTGI